ncbi:MAG: uracil-DNA glycosylase [Candidatus Curtissbacteria bacterium]|nr:uracil-DNA glycosylase [Candidatus Curtissbacteria bacterium]
MLKRVQHDKLMDEQKLLDEIAEEIEKCKTCKVGKTGKPVPGEGDPNAEIVFIGEAPGRTEGETGRPFIGRSGQYLTKLIESIGLNRSDVFITSPVKYFPIKSGKGRAPTDAEIAHGRKHLLKQLVIIDPKLIILLGKVASKAILKKDILVYLDHGKLLRENGRTYFITYHPAAAIRFQKFKALIEQDFKLLKRLIKK